MKTDSALRMKSTQTGKVHVELDEGSADIPSEATFKNNETIALVMQHDSKTGKDFVWVEKKKGKKIIDRSVKVELKKTE